MPETFAFGANEAYDTCCPLTAAGFSVSGRKARVAAQYDTYARIEVYEAFRGDDRPVADALDHSTPADLLPVIGERIPEDVARDCFKRAAEAQDAEDVYEAVAEKLGWE